VKFAWRVALPATVAALGSAGTLLLLGPDVGYFLEPREPRDLGEASAPLPDDLSNSFIRLRGVADLTGSLRVGRREGDLRVVRLSTSGVLAQVPAAGSPGTMPSGEGGLESSGLFDGRGRLWRAEDAPAFYGPVLRRFGAQGRVTHLLVAGEEPGSAWPGFAAAAAAGLLGALALGLAARAMVRHRAGRAGASSGHHSRGAPDGDTGL
jgi:hypothetical protein